MSDEDRLAALLDLEDRAAEARIMSWIAARLEHELRSHVSHEERGFHVIKLDEVASEAVTWAIMEADRRVSALHDAFHAAAGAP